MGFSSLSLNLCVYKSHTEYRYPSLNLKNNAPNLTTETACSFETSESVNKVSRRKTCRGTHTVNIPPPPPQKSQNLQMVLAPVINPILIRLT